MRLLRSISSAILSLGVVALGAYFIAKEVEIPVPESKDLLTVELVEEPCSNVEFLQEQITKKIELSTDCKTDNDCGVMILGCPFGCRTVINRRNMRFRKVP